MGDEEDISVKMADAPVERRASERRSTWDAEDIAALMRPTQMVRRPFVREETRATTAYPRVMVVKSGKAQKPTTCPGYLQRNQVGMLQAPHSTIPQARFTPSAFVQQAKPCDRSASPAPSMASTRCSSKESQCSTRSLSPCPSMTSEYSAMTTCHFAAPATESKPVETRKKTRRGNTKAKPSPPAKANEMTLMVRFLPYHYSPAALLQDVQAFLPNIDFFYLPTNFETKKNLGFAFFNFDDKVVAERFRSSGRRAVFRRRLPRTIWTGG